MKASVYVTEAHGSSYKAKITFSFEPPHGTRSMDVDCTLTRWTHDLKVYSNGKQLRPDEETSDLLEHLVLAGSKKIITAKVDIAGEQCGSRVCANTDIEYGTI